MNFYDIYAVYKVKTAKDKDKLLFEKEDIYKTDEHLSRLLRLICYKKKLKVKDVLDLIYNYYFEMGYDSKTLNSLKNNLLKRFQDPKITFKQFKKFCEIILRCSVQDIKVTLMEMESGNQIEYSLSDKIE